MERAQYKHPEGFRLRLACRNKTRMIEVTSEAVTMKSDPVYRLHEEDLFW